MDCTPDMKASILVLAYNHGPYIEECIESLVAQQTDFPFEILVGEDCSTDETREVLIAVAARHPEQVRLFLNETNLGAKANSAQIRNQASGTYIAYCEGDDYWHRRDKLRIQVELLETQPDVALVCSDVDVLIQSSGRRIPSVMRRIGQWQDWPEDVALGILTREVNIPICSVCLRRETLLAIHREHPYEFSEEHPMGDIQLFIEASRLGRMHRIQDSLATYRAIDESATRSKDPARVYDFLTRSLVVFEHYVRKLSYGSEIMNRVRMTHFLGLVDLAIRCRREDIRSDTLRLAIEKGIRGKRLTERVSLWSLKSPHRLRAGAFLLPWLRRFVKVSDRLPGFHRAACHCSRQPPVPPSS